MTTIARLLLVLSAFVCCALAQQPATPKPPPTSTPGPVNDADFWITLEKAHDKAMAAYTSSGPSNQITEKISAVALMQQAHVSEGLNRPPVKISNQKAAAILNDYGFLQINLYGSGEAYFRRATTLDPKRTIAYLNLADAIRKTISSLPTSSERQHAAEEARDSYRQYLSLGGKSNEAIQLYLASSFVPRTSATFCADVASYANSGRLGEFVSDRLYGVQTRHGKMDLYIDVQGTAHVPNLIAKRPGTDAEINDDSQLPELPTGTDALWGGDQLGLVTYQDKVWVIYYRDFGHLVSMKAVTPNALPDTCAFRTTFSEVIGPSATQPKLCAELSRGHNYPVIKFADPVSMSDEDVRDSFVETGIVGSHRLDVLGDGNPVTVAELNLASGAGPGCDETFYKLMDKSKTKFEDSETALLLDQMQGIDSANAVHVRYPVHCQNKPRFLNFEGHIYFEEKPATWPPVDTFNQYHSVTAITDRTVAEVCDFRFRTKVTAKGS